MGLWDIISYDKTQNYISSHKVEWKFIAENVPRCGGFYERLVRTVETLLRMIMVQLILKSEELTTILPEIEAIVNSQPLTLCTVHWYNCIST